MASPRPPRPPSPRPPAPAAAATPPACDAKTLKDCTPNSGDTAWMLTSVALVLMMTIPGLGLFYGGMVRKKNVGDTVMTSFAITCLVTVLFACVTYSLAFTGGDRLHRRLQPRLSAGHRERHRERHRQPESARADDPRDRLHVLPDDLRDHHAGADRGRLRGAHEVLGDAVVHRAVGDLRLRADRPLGLGPDGIFSAANTDEKGDFAGWVKVLDFAGGTVVHINAGVAGLMCALVLGKRRDTAPAHNMVLTFIGASLLWVGWFGFNAGSAVTRRHAGRHGDDGHPDRDARSPALTWMFVEWAHRGKPTVIGIASGAVAGLVAITPASGFVGPVGSMVIGVAAGIACYLGATSLKHAFGYDDALDCFGVHAVGGMVGAILTGVFAIEQYGGTAGLIEGNPRQVLNQIIGVAVVFIYDAVISLIILKIIDMAIGLRVDKDIELEGLDLALHGEAVQ